MKKGPFHLSFPAWRSKTDQEVAQHYLNAILETHEFLSTKFQLRLPAPPLNVLIVPPEELLRDDRTRDDPARNVSFYDPQDRVMVLPLRTSLPTIEEERAWMTAAARHEITHAMCDLELDERLMTSPWRWICEGFAAWVETQFPGSHYLTYAQAWCDYPQRPLGHATYDAFPFMAYFLDQMGLSAFTDLWANYQNSDPWDAILKIAAAADFDPQTFFADYCLESYIFRPHDPITAAIHQRFGARKAQETGPPGFNGRLERLACRYYTVAAPGEGGTVRIEGNGAEWANLNISLAQILSGPRLGRCCRLSRQSPVSAELPFETAEEILIVVSNDAQRQRFSLDVQLI